MGVVSDFVYNSIYEPLSDFGEGLLGREDEKIHDVKIAQDYQKDVEKTNAAEEARKAAAAAEAPRIAAKKAEAEAKRKAELRRKRLAEGGRTSTIHSVSPSPLAGLSVEDSLGGY